jgi:hypothetical protein
VPPSSGLNSKPSNQIPACLDNSPTLKAEMMDSSVMSVNLYQTTWGHIVTAVNNLRSNVYIQVRHVPS